MEKNGQGVHEKKKTDVLRDLFENETFWEYASLFYSEPRTITQVSEETNVARQTIYNHLQSFILEGEEYDTQFIRVLLKGSSSEKPLLFTHKIVIELSKHLAEKVNQTFAPTLEEEVMLLKFMDRPGVDKCLRKNCNTWPFVFARLSAVLVLTIYFDMMIKNKHELAQRVPQIKNTSILKLFTEDEQNALNRDTQEFIKENPTFAHVANEFCRLEIPIYFTAQDLSKICNDEISVSLYVANLFLNDPVLGKMAKRRILPKLRKEWGIKEK